MTDRIKGFVVVLDQDIREDDVQPLIDAIGLLRHVTAVKPLVAGIEDSMIRMRTTREISERLLEFIRKELA